MKKFTVFCAVCIALMRQTAIAGEANTAPKIPDADADRLMAQIDDYDHIMYLVMADYRVLVQKLCHRDVDKPMLQRFFYSLEYSGARGALLKRGSGNPAYAATLYHAPLPCYPGGAQEYAAKQRQRAH